MINIETDKNFYKKMLQTALPIAVQSVIMTGVNMVDTIMLGALGETALSASSLATQFVQLFTFLCMGISMGASVLTSRYWGAHNFDSLRKTITVEMCIRDRHQGDLRRNRLESCGEPSQPILSFA